MVWTHYAIAQTLECKKLFKKSYLKLLFTPADIIIVKEKGVKHYAENVRVKFPINLKH